MYKYRHAKGVSVLYADDIIMFASSAQELQNNLNILSEHCNRDKLIVNTAKTKIMFFTRGCILPRDMTFYYNDIELLIVSIFFIPRYCIFN